MQTFTVCFFGHRQIECSYDLEKRLYSIICDLISSNSYVEFLVGRDGAFDLLAASCVRRAKREVFDANSSLIWVQPYQKSEYKQNPADYDNYYDEIEICEASAVAHPKAAIQVRNRAMVDRSDLCVFFVAHPSGGAWQTMKYAKKQEKQIVSLNEGETSDPIH